MEIDNIKFTAIRTHGIITALWFGGTYTECCAAYQALLSHDYEPQQIEYMGLGLYSVIGMARETIWTEAAKW